MKKVRHAQDIIRERNLQSQMNEYRARYLETQEELQRTKKLIQELELVRVKIEKDMGESRFDRQDARMSIIVLYRTVDELVKILDEHGIGGAAVERAKKILHP